MKKVVFISSLNLSVFYFVYFTKSFKWNYRIINLQQPYWPELTSSTGRRWMGAVSHYRVASWAIVLPSSAQCRNCSLDPLHFSFNLIMFLSVFAADPRVAQVIFDQIFLIWDLWRRRNRRQLWRCFGHSDEFC